MLPPFDVFEPFVLQVDEGQSASYTETVPVPRDSTGIHFHSKGSDRGGNTNPEGNRTTAQ